MIIIFILALFGLGLPSTYAPAERLTPPSPPVEGIHFDTVSMPKVDYTGGNAQAAIDRCEGGVMFAVLGSVPLYGAHNTACPPERSFRWTLSENDVVIDGARYVLHSRTRHTWTIREGEVPIQYGVGLQTSITYEVVNISWYVPA